jgi:hypothetical protein
VEAQLAKLPTGSVAGTTPADLCKQRQHTGDEQKVKERNMQQIRKGNVEQDEEGMQTIPAVEPRKGNYE